MKTVLMLISFVLATYRFAEAQQATKVPQIGYLEGGPRSAHTSRMEAFRQGLRELGSEEGKNIVIEWRFGDGKVDIKAPSSSGNVSSVSPSLAALATELVGLKVAVIVTGGTGPTRAAKEATSTIPIVMAQDKNCVWLKPELVAQVEYTEWTPDGHLRHSKFCGLREDKDVNAVVKESERENRTAS